MNEHDDDEVIERLYDLVSAPSRYDEFMGVLEKRLDGIVDRQSEAPSQPSALVKHLTRAAELLDVVSPWPSQPSNDLQENLNQTMQAAFAIDTEGQLVQVNDTAALVYGLSIAPSVLELPLDDEDRARLLRAARHAIAGGSASNAANDVLKFQNLNKGTSVLVTLEPFWDEPRGQLLAVARTTDVGWPPYLGPILKDLFDLTSAELEVTKLMVEGRRVKDIAERRLISVATVRTQLRSIFAKTQTEGQLECIKLIFGLSLMHSRKTGGLVAARIQRSLETPFYPQENQRHTLKLPDGRILDYAVLGAPDGQVVLQHHCEITCDIWFREAVQRATQLGLKIVAPLRPGFGRSTVHRDRINDPHRCAEDATFLLDTLGIDRVAVFGVCCGFLPALATARAMPDRVVSVTSTRPYFPPLSQHELDGFTGYTKLVQQIRLRFPQALGFVVKAGFAFTAKAGPLAFSKSLVGASPEDVAWLTQGDIAPFTHHSLATHRRQGYLGIFSDLSYRGDWRDLLWNCPVPVRMLAGTHDRCFQWNEAESWAEKLPHAQLETLPDSGYMVHHQHANRILAWLKEDF